MPSTSHHKEVRNSNAFRSDLARVNSSYAAFENNKLVRVLDPEQRPSPLMELVHDSFRALMLSHSFSCVGAKAAVHKGDYRMGMYGQMNTPEAAAGLAHDLFAFVQERPHMGSSFTTFIASFAEPHPVDELHFEQLLWQQLQALHDLLCIPGTRPSRLIQRTLPSLSVSRDAHSSLSAFHPPVHAGHAALPGPRWSLMHTTSLSDCARVESSSPSEIQFVQGNPRFKAALTPCSAILESDRRPDNTRGARWNKIGSAHSIHIHKK